MPDASAIIYATRRYHVARNQKMQRIPRRARPRPMPMMISRLTRAIAATKITPAVSCIYAISYRHFFVLIS